jgi:hypothetical protein
MSDYILLAIGFLSSMVTIIGFVYAFIENFKIEINSRFDRLDKRVNGLENRFDGWIKHSLAMHAEQEKKTEKMYEMFIESLSRKKE